MDELDIRQNDDGTLDEIVGAGTFHLEQMDGGHWWMLLVDRHGAAVHVHLQSRSAIKATFDREQHSALSPSERQEAEAAGQGERVEARKGDKLGAITVGLHDEPGIVLLRRLVDSICIMNNGEQDVACWDHGAMFELRDYLCDRASLPASPSQGQSAAARDVLAERQRQISAEGWTPEHDNAHADGSLACAASCYACAAAGLSDAERDWPWNGGFKVASPRRMLVKAGALILAEIERLDRAAPSQPAQGDA